MITKLFVDILVGVFLIPIGWLIIRYTYKNPSESFKYNDHGLYMVGGFFMVLGIASIFGYGGDLTEAIYDELKNRFK